MLIATHQINYLNEADYIYHLKDGKLIEEGGPEILTDQTEIGQAYERFIASAASSQQKPSESEGPEGPQLTSEKSNEAKTEQRVPRVSARPKRSEIGPQLEEDSVADEESPLVEPNTTCSTTKQNDKRDQAKPSTYYRVIKFGVGFGLIGILLLLYMISIGLCQATVYWFGLWMNNLRLVFKLVLAPWRPHPIRDGPQSINLKTHLREPNLKQSKSESTTYSVWNDNQFYYLVFVSSSGAIVIFTILRAVLYAYSGVIRN